jgi:outer membrane protein assembly factor BamB
MRTRLMGILGLIGGMWWTTVTAGDWPQILGPQRNGIAPGEKLRAKWDSGKLTPAWTVDCGSGLAGVAVADGAVVLFHRSGDETLSAFDAETGKPRWKQTYRTNFEAQIVDDDGPRAVPSIAGGKVFAYGAAGRLIAVDFKTGEPLWNRETHKEYGAPGGYFGAGSAPLVEGKGVIVNVGGPKGAGVVAFDVMTGKPVWQTSNELASYAAPVMATLGGQRRALVITRFQFLGLDPATGKEAFRVPFGARGPTVNGASPVLIGDNAFLTASYGIGGKLIKLSANNAEIVWEDEILSSQCTTPIVHEGKIYGVDGRQDGGPVSLKCFDPATRKLHWEQSLSQYATLIAADGNLLVMQTDGELRIVSLDSDKYIEKAKLKLLPLTTRALPALANGRLYVRNERMLACFDLRGE